MSAHTNFRSLAALVSDKSTVFTFSNRKAYVTKFDLAVKQVKVTPGSSFEQTIMGWSPRCYIPSFVEIGLPVLEKKIFECFFYNIWTWRPSWSCDQMPRTKYRSPYPRRLHIAVSEKKIFEHCERRRRRRTTDGRTPDHEYPISSPMSLWLR